MLWMCGGCRYAFCAAPGPGEPGIRGNSHSPCPTYPGADLDRKARWGWVLRGSEGMVVHSPIDVRTIDPAAGTSARLCGSSLCWLLGEHGVRAS